MKNPRLRDKSRKLRWVTLFEVSNDRLTSMYVHMYVYKKWFCDKRFKFTIYSPTWESISGSTTTFLTSEQKRSRWGLGAYVGSAAIAKEISNVVCASLQSRIHRNRICNAIALALYSDSIINPPYTEHWIRSCYAISDPWGPRSALDSFCPHNTR